MNIEQVLEKIRELNDELTKYTTVLTALRSICEHEWTYSGHGHNDDLYICRKCGKEEWR